MLDMRLRGFKAFLEKPMPVRVWILGFNADDFRYLRQANRRSKAKAGTNCLTASATPTIVSASRRRKNRLVSGVAASYESEVIYNSIQEAPEEAGRHLRRHGHRFLRQIP